MKKYSTKQLAEIVKGAFKCSPKEKVFYGSENGTFLNQQQFDKLTEADQKNYTHFKNPAIKENAEADESGKGDAGASASATPDKTWKVADLQKYAADNGIALDEKTDKTKDQILAKIAAAAPKE